MGTDGSRHSVGKCEGQCDRSHAERVKSVPRYICYNGVNVRVAGQGTSQFMNDVSKDIACQNLLIPTNKILFIFLMI
jgi:hypothetical protein